MFSALGDAGCTGRVLDLYAGSGALGIEALSRGADWCDFVESSASACRAISRNVEKTRLSARSRVHCRTVEAFLSTTVSSDTEPYALILLDPPYDLSGLDRSLTRLGTSALIAPGGTILLEHSSRRAPPVAVGPLPARRTRMHGDSAFTLYWE